MLNKKELIDFVAFCQTKYNIIIDESVINEYVVYGNYISQPEVKNPDIKEPVNTKCGTHGISCSHIAFNTAKCSSCLN
jgi:hypothetical protein